MRETAWNWIRCSRVTDALVCRFEAGDGRPSPALFFALESDAGGECRLDFSTAERP